MGGTSVREGAPTHAVAGARGRAARLGAVALLAGIIGGPTPAAAQAGIQCAFQVQATPKPHRVNDPGASLDEGYIIGTAALVRHAAGGGAEKYYLVTAYHVVYDTVNLKFKAGDFNLGIGTGEVDPEFYYNRVSDLAIFRVTDVGRAKIDAPSPEDSPLLKVRPVTLLTRPRRHAPEPSLGMQALALGNPKIVAYRAENVVYSCTISEVVPASKRIGSTISDPDPAVVKAASDLPMLFLETLSIDKGFSGGPVLVTGGAQPLLAGIVLGGNPGLIVGRSAFACRALDVEDGIQVLEGTRDPEDPKIEYKRTYRTGAAPGGGTALAVNWPRRVHDYGSTFSFSGTRVVEPQDLPGGEFRDFDWPKQGRPAPTPPPAEGDEEDPFYDHVVYVLDRVTFRKVRFHESDLTNFQFINCVFEDVCFDDALLNGAVFTNCTFRLHNPPNVEGVLRDFGRPRMAYGVQIRNPKYEVVSSWSEGEPPAPPPAPVASASTSAPAAAPESAPAAAPESAPAPPAPAPAPGPERTMALIEEIYAKMPPPPAALPAPEAAPAAPVPAGPAGASPLRVVRFPSRAFDLDGEFRWAGACPGR